MDNKSEYFSLFEITFWNKNKISYWLSLWKVKILVIAKRFSVFSLCFWMSVCIFHNIMQTASSLHYLLELLLINKYRYTSENKKVTPIYLFIRKISHTSSWTQYCFMWTWFVSVWERGVKIGWIDRFIFAMKRFFSGRIKRFTSKLYVVLWEKSSQL